MDTLMELVRTGTPHVSDYNNTDPDIEKVARLESLGLCAAAQKYLNEIHQKTLLSNIAKLKIIKISEEQIHQYLDRKVEDYNKKHVSQQDISNYDRALSFRISVSHINWHPIYTSDTAAVATPQNDIAIPTKHFHLNGKNTIGQYCWTETKIEDYKGIPPEFVLEKIEQYKQNFDYMTIAEVNAIKDPLLLGRVNDCTDRFFLKQWGEDVKLDDII